MVYYTIQDKTSVWLCLEQQGLTTDVIEKIWKTMLDEKEKDAYNNTPPPAPKKKISERTTKMMNRWITNGIWERHKRNIQFDEINPIFIQN